MTTFLLMYERLSSAERRWQPLLQQQAIMAVARAVLSRDRSEETALSDHLLIAPANLDILPLLAMAARDYAAFAEPESPERPRAPISLYEDDSMTGDHAPEMEHLFHPAWFRRLGVSLEQAVTEFKPEVGILAAPPSHMRDRLVGLRHRFGRLLYLQSLSLGLDAVADDRLGPFIAIDENLERHIRAAEEQMARDGILPKSTWEAMFADEERPDLEPFTAFGPAFELAIFGRE